MLQINSLSYRVEGRPLFESASATIADGWKVGFVGRNGTGKSTLLRMIRGEIAPDEGDLQTGPRHRIGGVSQEAPATPRSLLELVLEFDEERAALLLEAETAHDPLRIAEIHQRLSHIGAHSAEARASAILSGLGFSSADHQRPTSDFSGGWRMRIALAGVLFSTPDLLLLDEPTNYLDLEGVIWLENFIRRFPNTAIIVSHDRDFLNRSVAHILALENRKLNLLTGNYDEYEQRREQMRQTALAHRSKQEAQRRHLQTFIDRFRAKASKAKQAQSRVKALEKLQLTPIPTDERSHTFSFASPEQMAPPIIRIVDGRLGYENDNPILTKINFRLDNDDRIAILGPNGEGKSTLVKSIAGRLPLLGGEIVKNKKLQIAYFSQDQTDELDVSKTPYDLVRAIAPASTESEIRALAGRFGFPGMAADTTISRLSGGEKTRLLLGLITHKKPHLIILDEPTNHLDIDARENLADALNAFAGAILLITHDAHLAGAVADQLWLVKDGGVKTFEGDLDDYRELILNAEKTARSAAEKKPEQKSSVRQVTLARREEVAQLRRDAGAAESRIQRLSDILVRLDAALSEPGLYEKDAARAIKLQKERAALVSTIAAEEELWLERLEALESAQKKPD